MPTLRANVPTLRANPAEASRYLPAWNRYQQSLRCCAGQHLAQPRLILRVLRWSTSITVATVALGGRRDAVDADGGGLAHDRLRGGCGPVVLVDVRLLAIRAAGFHLR